ncbi:extracellular solute-binding protein [Nonomuraea turkmeniaca]|uniref:Extracellular solute-binding protein n=1 Tax=Nonomuraea turkmeniaca TaxID=103838 RepID=A0A5S4F5Q0_9ACTN|nr:extracellular solute-binding protein [Nonomuraea turkmeniaca]TMR11281.1 extracellular solute-binding protein [Nonomuraea turkmeniaca]
MTLTTRTIAGLALIAATVTACAPGAAPTEAPDAGKAVSSALPTEPVTLTLSHFEEGGQGKAIEQLAAKYQQLHPNITIKPTYTAFADYGKNIKLQMSSESAPDIAQAGQAQTMQGPLVQAGLLRPLDEYAKLYGWSERFKPGLLDQARFSKDGKTFGTGELYGIALGGNLVGIYYNRDKLAKLGITTPFKDLAAFQDALAKAKAAGETPIQLGNLEAWPGNHVLSDLIAQYEPLENGLNWVYGRKGATFDSPGVQQATKTLAEWAKSGYIDSSANGTSDSDGVGKFIKGKGVFMVSGSWNRSRIDENMDGKAGFTAMPPVKAGDPVRATGATTSPFSISAKTKYPDVAAGFIDFMTRPENAATLFQGGYLPVAERDAGQPKAGSAQEGLVETWQQVLADDGLALYLDWATPSMGDTLFPAVQQLIAGKTTPDELISTVQENWADERGNG